MCPFSEPTLTEIKKRSHGRSEISGRTDRPLECSHFDHARNEKYNTADNGIRTTTIEHLAYHIHYRDNPQEIGLTMDGNEAAIRLCNERAFAFLEKIGKTDLLDTELGEAILLWERILEGQ